MVVNPKYKYIRKAYEGKKIRVIRQTAHSSWLHYIDIDVQHVLDTKQGSIIIALAVLAFGYTNGGTPETPVLPDRELTNPDYVFVHNMLCIEIERAVHMYFGKVNIRIWITNGTDYFKNKIPQSKVQGKLF